MADDLLQDKVIECTRSLKDDPELAAEIRRELRSHLLDAQERLVSSGRSVETAAREACRIFGDSNELDQALLLANFSRLKTRTRLRRILRIALLPLLALGVWAACDLRFLESARAFSESFFSRDGRAERIADHARKILLAAPNLSRAERELLLIDRQEFTKYSEKDWENLLGRYGKGNVLLRYILETAACRTYSKAALAALRKSDPDNGLADIIESGHLTAQAVRYTSGGTAAVIDRKKLDRATDLLADAMKKRYIRPHSRAASQRAVDLSGRGENIPDLMDRILVSSSLSVGHARHFQSAARGALIRGGLAEKEGKTKDAAYFLDIWRPLLAVWNEQSFTLMEQMAIGRILKMNLEAAEKRGDGRRAEELRDAAAVMRRFRAEMIAERTHIPYHRSGFFCAMLTPPGTVIPEAELECDRKISYIMLDILLCACLGILCLSVLLFYGVAILHCRYRKRPVFWLIPPLKKFVMLTLCGLLLPVLAYLILSGTDVLSGRDTALFANLPRTISLGVFFLSLPFICQQVMGGFYKKRLKELGISSPDGRGIYLLNSGTTLLVAFVLISVTVRTAAELEQKYWTNRGRTLYCTANGFMRPENELVRKLRRAHAGELEGSSHPAPPPPRRPAW